MKSRVSLTNSFNYQNFNSIKNGQFSSTVNSQLNINSTNNKNNSTIKLPKCNLNFEEEHIKFP